MFNSTIINSILPSRFLKPRVQNPTSVVKRKVYTAIPSASKNTPEMEKAPAAGSPTPKESNGSIAGLNKSNENIPVSKRADGLGGFMPLIANARFFPVV